MKYSIGLDFGTLSGRAVLVEVETGNIISQSTKEYRHGVMDEYLPCGNLKLPMDWALQHPRDYLEVIEYVIPQVIKDSGVSSEDIIGISVDFTSCTILPIDKAGAPLCFNDEFKDEPHAYVKLWKHHAAEAEANFATLLAKRRNESFINKYGGKLSSEWFIPKVLQVLNESPLIYEAADSFIEAGDWINLILTGTLSRSSCCAGYKGTWNKSNGYPSKDYFKALDPRMENFVEEKLKGTIFSIGQKAGELNEEWANKTGLKEGTAVGISIIDAHAGVPGIGINDSGKMLMIIGTSTCHIMLSETNIFIPGIGGIVEDGIIPGFFAYEAGQAGVGDLFSWLVENYIPERYLNEADKKGINIHTLLTELAQELKPGESGLLALDWWNGNRTPYVDYDLTGMIIGLNLSTKVEEIYRTLIEATAYGTYRIIESFEDAGLSVNELYACGGIAAKNEMMMQIYADVTNKEIHLSSSNQTSALGAAILGAVAAGKEAGGYDTIGEAAKEMSGTIEKVYRPIPENVEVYKRLYDEYKILSEYFANGGNNVMKKLKDIRISTNKSNL